MTQLEERPSMKPLWTVAVRTRGGDPYYHKVVDLHMPLEIAVDLAVYINRTSYRKEARVIRQDQTVQYRRRKNRQWAKIRVLDNGSLPFETRT